MSKQASDKIKAGIDAAIGITRGKADPIAALTPKVRQTDSTALARADRAR